jgi:hypothetical protein
MRITHLTCVVLLLGVIVCSSVTVSAARSTTLSRLGAQMSSKHAMRSKHSRWLIVPFPPGKSTGHVSQHADFINKVCAEYGNSFCCRNTVGNLASHVVDKSGDLFGWLTKKAGSALEGVGHMSGIDMFKNHGKKLQTTGDRLSMNADWLSKQMFGVPMTRSNLFYSYIGCVAPDLAYYKQYFARQAHHAVSKVAHGIAEGVDITAIKEMVRLFDEYIPEEPHWEAHGMYSKVGLKPETTGVIIDEILAYVQTLLNAVKDEKDEWVQCRYFGELSHLATDMFLRSHLLRRNVQVTNWKSQWRNPVASVDYPKIVAWPTETLQGDSDKHTDDHNIIKSKEAASWGYLATGQLLLAFKKDMDAGPGRRSFTATKALFKHLLTAEHPEETMLASPFDGVKGGKEACPTHRRIKYHGLDLCLHPGFCTTDTHCAEGGKCEAHKCSNYSAPYGH